MLNEDEDESGEVKVCRIFYLMRIGSEIITKQGRGLAIGLWPESKLKMLDRHKKAIMAAYKADEVIPLGVEILEESRL